MKNPVLKFGLLSGAFLGLLTGVVFPLSVQRGSEVATSQVVGYAAMVVAFTAVFFGIRSYRENAGGGAITFGKAFQVGILIVLIASAMYVIGWQITFWGFMPDFGDRYAAMSLEKLRAGGASASELAEHEAAMERFKVLYRKPLFNVAMTFMEVFPVGLIVTLLSAAILRKRGPAGDPSRASATA